MVGLVSDKSIVEAGGSNGGQLDFVEAMIRVILILPAAWLTKFTAARHASLFKLRENYAYKYSVAMSVDGFKRQAKGYENEIAAATFFELRFNPAEKLDAKGAAVEHPNPVLEWVMNKIGATHDGKSS
jgi:hypothetical protein